MHAFTKYLGFADRCVYGIDRGTCHPFTLYIALVCVVLATRLSGTCHWLRRVVLATGYGGACHTPSPQVARDTFRQKPHQI
jgi:hypothetical protein